MVYDKDLGRKKVSFGEKQIKELIIKYPHDGLYPAILEYRSIDKLAGTYVGRISQE
jgi:DNA polymerase I-like protein with 3'-5' exonuclease and polymerase domains